MQKKQTQKVYIGFTGEKGGGKDTVIKLVRKLLPKKKIGQIRFSDILTDTLNIWALPRTRENYIKLSPSFRRTYGPSALSNAVKARAEAASDDIVFLNGVRWWEDVKMVRGLNKKGSKSFLVYVTAPVRIRFARIKNRGEKAGEREATFHQFMKEEKAYTEIFIPKIGKKADVVIDNGDTMNKFRNAIKSKILPLITRRAS
ncbi:MAG: hypothetical protein Q7S66_05825 [bacterium]|nr:hypothetical protein [bacterium]